jgi:hypothetical protein
MAEILPQKSPSVSRKSALSVSALNLNDIFCAAPAVND